MSSEARGRRAIGLHWREFVFVLFVIDALIVVAVMFGTVQAWDAIRADFTPTELFADWFVGTCVVWLVALRATGAYDPLGAETGRGRAGSLIRALAVVAGVTLVAYFFAPRAFPRSTTLVTPLPVFLALLAWRGLAADRLATWRVLQRRVLLLGAGEMTVRLADLLARSGRGAPYLVVAFVADGPERPASVAGVPILAGTDEIWAHARRLDVQEIVVARDEPLAPACRERLVECFNAGVAIGDAAQLYEALAGRVPIGQIGPGWYADLPSLPRRPYFTFKRVVDVAGSAILLVALAPLLLLVVLAVAVTSGRPVLYRQVRLGRRGMPFTVHKVRTMSRDAEASGPQYARRSDPRATRLGGFLRRTGVDELPQLWNVLRGEMSLIGPRPERPEFVADLVSALPLYWARTLVRPGIVGWAEVHVRHAETLEKHLERLEYDLYYIKRAEPLLDIDIALRALALVLTGRR